MNFMAGEYLKQQGQARAADRTGYAWREQALYFLSLYTIPLRDGYGGSDEFTMDDFRTYAEARGLCQPASLNAWGALPRSAVARGMIRATGEYAKAARVEARARRVAVWVAV